MDVFFGNGKRSDLRWILETKIPWGELHGFIRLLWRHQPPNPTPGPEVADSKESSVDRPVWCTLRWVANAATGWSMPIVGAT